MAESSERATLASRGPSLTVELDRGPALPKLSRWRRANQVIARTLHSKAPSIRPVLALAVFAIALFVFVVLLLGPTANLIAGHRINELHGKERFDALNSVRQTLVAAAAGFAAAVGLAFTARTYALSKRAQEVDRFTRAVSLLSSEKQSERIGGLLTIEYVLRERNTEARAAVEVVCSFIRERSAVTVETYRDVRSAPPQWGGHGDEIADDIQTALMIIGANYPRPQRFMLDLSNTNLRGAGLAGSNFSGVKLFGCLMQGASFVGADLKHARLDGSVMVGAWLARTDLRRATLRDVDLRGANLTNAQVDPSQLLPAIVDDSTVLDEHIRTRLDELKNSQA